MRFPSGKQLAYVLGVIVLVPLAITLEYSLSKGEESDPASRPPQVATGAARVDFAGVRWRLASIRSGPAKKDATVPKGTTLVFATVEVSPTTAAAAKKIMDCDFEAIDGEGNTWISTSFGLADTGGAAQSCSVEVDDEEQPIPVGRVRPVLATFLVPTEAAPKLRLRLWVRGERRELELRR